MCEFINDVEYPAIWPAIFTQDEWDLMNARRIERATRWPGKSRGTGRTYLLTGLLYCGNCNAYMVGSRRKQRDQYQRRYKCRRVDNYGQPLGCGQVFRGADPLEAFVTEAVLHRFSTPEVLRALTDTDENGIDELIAEYQAAKLRLDQMVRDYAQGFLNREEFAVAKQVAEGSLQAARDALANAQSRKVRGVLPSPDSILELWESAGLDLKHSIIGLVVDKVICLPGHPGSHEWHGWRFNPDLIRIVWRV